MGTKGIISRFADDTKLGGSEGCNEVAGKLQGHMERLREWARIQQIVYNEGKCEVTNFGREIKQNFLFNGYSLKSISFQKGPGLPEHKNHLKVTERYSKQLGRQKISQLLLQKD